MTTARQEFKIEEQYRMQEEERLAGKLCDCGTPLEGQYNNGEEHDECAACREGRLCDEAYERGRDV